jgi:hypothetical protein
MRRALAVLLLANSVAAQGVLDECPLAADAQSPNQHWRVHFRQTAPDDEWNNWGEVTVYRDGRKLLKHRLPRLVARAAWSPDSKYCVFTTVNSHGHSAWNFTAYVFSRARRAFRRLDDVVGDVTEPTFRFEAPDVVVFNVLDRSRDTGESKQSRAALHEIFAKLPRDDQI